MSGYSCAWGQPPMNCNICGSRVPREKCERHPREPGYIALRDKYIGIFVIRASANEGSGK
jgi:hypothetical protein